ncbi:MAG TPA: Entericidin EcnA/B family protein [Sphingomonadaceae bacterium]
MFRKLVIALSPDALTLAMAVCNTVEGAGQGIQSAGQAGDDAIHGK